jgi:hypothetical protein
MDQDCASARGLASFVVHSGQDILRGKPSDDFRQLVMMLPTTSAASLP